MSNSREVMVITVRLDNGWYTSDAYDIEDASDYQKEHSDLEQLHFVVRETKEECLKLMRQKYPDAKFLDGELE